MAFHDFLYVSSGYSFLCMFFKQITSLTILQAFTTLYALQLTRENTHQWKQITRQCLISPDPLPVSQLASYNQNCLYQDYTKAPENKSDVLNFEHSVRF